MHLKEIKCIDGRSSNIDKLFIEETTELLDKYAHLRQCKYKKKYTKINMFPTTYSCTSIFILGQSKYSIQKIFNIEYFVSINKTYTCFGFFASSNMH